MSSLSTVSDQIFYMLRRANRDVKLAIQSHSIENDTAYKYWQGAALARADEALQLAQAFQMRDRIPVLLADVTKGYGEYLQYNSVSFGFSIKAQGADKK